MQMLGKVRLVPVSLLVLACTFSGKSQTRASVDSSAIRAHRRDSTRVSLVERTGARLVADSSLPAYRTLSATYTIDLQRMFLSDTSPIVLESSLQDIAQSDSGVMATFGPRFSVGSLYLHLSVPAHLVNELMATPRDPFGSDLLIAVKPRRISRPLFQFNSRDRSSNSLPPALEAEVGDVFVLEGFLVGLGRIPS
jgi:hypothetical protein